MKYKIVIIGGSAGSFQVVTKILSQLPKDYPYPVVLALHRLKHVRHGFVEALSIKSNLPVVEPNDKDPIKAGKIYLAPANYHLYIDLAGTFALSTEEPVNHSRPGIDLTFITGAYAYKNKAIGVILSGANKDGALGLKKIKDWGGLTIVQSIEESQMPTMPQAALEKTKDVDYILNTEGIIRTLITLAKS
ncbi:MAG: chemotaxis protein CheB [Bacteroidales bacterium]|nr:chemotaxis protein CheB [Bacteroidales bacterium]